MRFKCPNCSNNITIKEKLRINSATNTFCKVCGQRINTPFWASCLLSVLSYFAVYFTLSFVHSIIGKVLGILAIIILLIVAGTAFTPLKKGK